MAFSQCIPDLIMHSFLNNSLIIDYKSDLIFCHFIVIIKAKLVQEFKEKIALNMLGTLQKHVKDGHINGSEVC